jgi:hypothetical protein
MGARAPQVFLNRADRNAQLASDLCVRQVLQVIENPHCPGALGQLVESRDELLDCLGSE